MVATAPEGSTRPAMLGRDDVLARVTRHLSRARDGAGGLLWVRGEAGIGKTRLLDELADLAVAAGARVLRAAGWEDASGPPFWLWTQVLREALRPDPDPAELLARDPRARAVLRLLPELDPGYDGPPPEEPGAARFPLFDGMGAVLERLAGSPAHPPDGAAPWVVVLLDDVHWADEGSLRLLQFLSGTWGRRRILVVAAWRDHDVAPGSVLERVAGEVAARAEVVTLAGLAPAEVGRLVEACAGTPLGPQEVARLHERTAGNPLFAVEVGRLMRDRGLTEAMHGVPSSARTIIQRRLAHVSQPCHDLLALAAVAGATVPLEVLTRLSGLPPTEVARLLDEAVVAHLVVRRTGAVELAHPLVRDALVELLPAGRAREAHLALAGILQPLAAADPRTAAEVAHHLVRALPLGSLDAAVDAVERAARVAFAAQAYEQAARLLEQAVGLVPSGGARLPELLLARAEAALAAGEAEAGRRAYVAAADLYRARDDAVGLARAALGLGSGLSGFEVRLWDQTQIDLLDEALARLPDSEPGLRAEVMARLSVAVAFTERAGERTALADRAVALARRTGSAPTVARALAAHCDAVAGPDHAELREAQAGEVVRLAQESGERGLELLGLRLRVVSLLEQGRTREARADMRHFSRVAERVGQPLYSWYVALWRGFEAHLVGDLDELERCAQEVERVGALAESRNAATLAFVQRVWLGYERLQFDETAARLDTLTAELAEVAPDGVPLAGLYPGQGEHLRREAREHVAERIAALSVDAEYVSNLCQVALALWLAREPARCAAPVHAALLPHASRFAVDGIAVATFGSTARLVGVLAALMGRYDEAVQHLEHALAANAAAGARLALAHTRWMYAEVLELRAEERDAGLRRRLLEEALAEYRSMGLAEAAAQTERALAVVAASADRPAEPPPAGSFVRTGSVWTVTFRDRTAVVPHVKGMTDLARLLAHPGAEVHALDLVRGAPAPPVVAAGEPGVTGSPGDLGEVLDAQARSAYRRRLAELEVELTEADAAGDAAAGERAAAEREALVTALSAAYGLGGRPRRAGDPAERARTTVTWRLRDAVRRLGDVHPDLARHLHASLRTGVFCSYRPEQDQRWETGPTS